MPGAVLSVVLTSPGPFFGAGRGGLDLKREASGAAALALSQPVKPRRGGRTRLPERGLQGANPSGASPGRAAPSVGNASAAQSQALAPGYHSKPQQRRKGFSGVNTKRTIEKKTEKVDFFFFFLNTWYKGGFLLNSVLLFL